jgi:hypothetical protein
MCIYIYYVQPYLSIYSPFPNPPLPYSPSLLLDPWPLTKRLSSRRIHHHTSNLKSTPLHAFSLIPNVHTKKEEGKKNPSFPHQSSIQHKHTCTCKPNASSVGFVLTRFTVQNSMLDLGFSYHAGASPYAYVYTKDKKPPLPLSAMHVPTPWSS